MATLTGTHSSRLATQTATVVQLLAMFDEQQTGTGWRKRVCTHCWVEKPTRGQHACWE
jgi:hypothetical protein